MSSEVDKLIERGSILRDLPRRYKRNTLIISLIVIALSVDSQANLKDLSLLGIKAESRTAGAVLISIFGYNAAQFLFGALNSWRIWHAAYKYTCPAVSILFVRPRIYMPKHITIVTTGSGKYLTNVGPSATLSWTMTVRNQKVIRWVFLQFFVFEVLLPTTLLATALYFILTGWR